MVVERCSARSAISGLRLKDTVNGHEREIPVSGHVPGHRANARHRFLKGKLDLDSKGYVKLRDGGRSFTSVEGVFRRRRLCRFRFIIARLITAAGMGCRAAIDAEAGSPSREWIEEELLAVSY